ncbi:proline dehydrogenase family protein [Granulicoccus phenolivorans]|uniref:proline dehydrogenase family protein n=1 Tax=Granulicoccus phenolivorans TaxID=266854 RepID=UPI000426BE67|nr:bifunctional proline dehydrogenase/L-glutamate gamma-semialdehyde dehydrogenase [Granulicoccus phenolivorans]
MTARYPDPEQVRALAPAAVDQVRTWLAAAAQHRTTFAERQLAGVLQDPAGLDFTVGFVDRVIRPEDPRVAARALAELAPHAPAFLPAPLRVGLRTGGRLAPLAPVVAVPAVRAALRRLVRHLIIDATEAQLGPAIARLRADGYRLNLNLLGEAILGREEAARRLAGIRRLIERPDVDYVSVKVSAATAPHNPWAFEEAVTAIAAELTPFYELAAAQTPPTFLNLDMEEYRDLRLTVAVFRRILDNPALRHAEAGIALQAYLPDALAVLIDLQAYAATRIAAGGAPIKVRVVKGANLPMERVESRRTGWPLVTWPTKRATDTNYLRLLDYALTPERTAGVRIGIAGHNLFHIALARLLITERGVSTAGPSPAAEFEMLLGMAGGQTAAVRRDVGTVRLYTPVVHPDEFDSAIAYLVRRLDEGAAADNFLSAAYTLDDPAMFAREADRFRAGVRDLDSAVPRPNRSPRTAGNEPLPRAAENERLPRDTGRFRHTCDTDPALAENQTWARAITAAIPDSRLGVAEAAAARVRSPADIERALAAAVAAGRQWRTLPGAARGRVLLAVARALAAHRAELLEVAAAETGKTLDQGDPEVSEAVDFARYYARLARRLDEVPGATFHPVGLILVVPPWNFPIAIPAGGVLAALAAGAPVVVKPAPQAVRTGTVLARIITEGLRTGLREAGLDDLPVDDLVTPVTLGPDAEEATLGPALITHPAVERVILTGSYQTAELFARLRPGLPLLAETSGKNAIIVTPSADRDLAVADLVASAFGHAGQKCSAASLAVLVGSVADSRRFHRQLIDAASSLVVGYPDDPRTQVGPVIEPPGEKLRRGLTELGPGERWALRPRQLDSAGRLWSPGIRLGVRPGSDAHRTEYFGPVLGVLTADTLEEAIGLVNAVDYGLTSGLQSLDPAEVARWIDTVEAGNLYLNRGITGAIVGRQPFGGWKSSAVGPGTKAGGPHYLFALGEWSDAPGPDGHRTRLTGRPRRLAEAAGLTRAETDWLARAWALDALALREVYAATDLAGLGIERNILRHLPVPVTIRWCSGPLVHLLRVIGAGRRAGAPLRVSVPRELPPALDTLLRLDTAITLTVEDEAAFRAGVTRRGDTRVRLVGRPDQPVEVSHPSLARYAGAVVSAGEVELLPFLREQSISATAHRFGTPDDLTPPSLGENSD